MRIVVDGRGVSHRLERGEAHDTRCGVIAPRPLRIEAGEPDCLACVGGQSRLVINDLFYGTDVVALVQLTSDQGVLVGEPMELTFTKGVNTSEGTFKEVPPGTTVAGYVWMNEDGRRLWVNSFAHPLIVREEITLVVEIGSARLTVAPVPPASTIARSP